MKLNEFKVLDFYQQMDYLQQEGIYVGKCKDNTQHVLLYQLHSFYVELFYAKHRLYLEHIRCFQSTALLDPYLENIAIDHFVYP